MRHGSTPNPASLGTALRRMRLLRGIKQTHFAQLMGVNQATVSRWERGQLALSAAQQATAHRLLAASPSRQAEWRADAAEFMRRSLIGYASAEILAAEATLDGLGWHAGELSSLEIATGANADPVIPIVSGRVVWERIALADGCAGRIVTTIA